MIKDFESTRILYACGCGKKAASPTAQQAPAAALAQAGIAAPNWPVAARDTTPKTRLRYVGNEALPRLAKGPSSQKNYILNPGALVINVDSVDAPVMQQSGLYVPA